MSFDCNIIRQKKHPKLTPWNRIHLEKPIAAQLMNKLPAFYEIRGFISLSSKTFYSLMSYSSWINSTPSHHIPLRSILILSCGLRLDLPNDLLPSGFFDQDYVRNIKNKCAGDKFPSLCLWYHISISNFVIISLSAYLKADHCSIPPRVWQQRTFMLCHFSNSILKCSLVVKDAYALVL
jgi:hypothetical protein